MNRLLGSLAAGTLALGLCVGLGAPAQAGGLQKCGSSFKVKNIGCTAGGAVLEEGYARLLDADARKVRFDGWTCKRKNTEADRFTCTKKKAGKKQVVKLTG